VHPIRSSGGKFWLISYLLYPAAVSPFRTRPTIGYGAQWYYIGLRPTSGRMSVPFFGIIAELFYSIGNRIKIMNLLRLSWWLTPLISFFWVRARDQSVRSKFKKTLSCLKWIRRMRGSKIRPLGQWTTEYYLLQGHAHYELEQKEEAMESFSNGFRELRKIDIYTGMEENYLVLYVLTTHPELELGRQEPVDIKGIDLDRIDPNLRNYYPLKAHPEWDR
jgi:hypothetical protein